MRRRLGFSHDTLLGTGCVLSSPGHLPLVRWRRVDRDEQDVMGLRQLALAVANAVAALVLLLAVAAVGFVVLSLAEVTAGPLVLGSAALPVSVDVRLIRASTGGRPGLASPEGRALTMHRDATSASLRQRRHHWPNWLEPRQGSEVADPGVGRTVGARLSR